MQQRPQLQVQPKKAASVTIAVVIAVAIESAILVRRSMEQPGPDPEAEATHLLTGEPEMGPHREQPELVVADATKRLAEGVRLVVVSGSPGGYRLEPEPPVHLEAEEVEPKAVAAASDYRLDLDARRKHVLLDQLGQPGEEQPDQVQAPEVLVEQEAAVGLVPEEELVPKGPA